MDAIALESTIWSNSLPSSVRKPSILVYSNCRIRVSSKTCLKTLHCTSSRVATRPNSIFAGSGFRRCRLRPIAVKCSETFDDSVRGNVNIRVLEILVKRGLVLAAICCGVLVIGCRRVVALEGVVNGIGNGFEQSALLTLRNSWPKVLQVLVVFKEQGLILAALFGLSAFFSMAETSITTLWPWKVRELAEKESDDGVFKMLRTGVTRFLTTILIGTIVVNIVRYAIRIVRYDTDGKRYGIVCVSFLRPESYDTRTIRYGIVRIVRYVRYAAIRQMWTDFDFKTKKKQIKAKNCKTKTKSNLRLLRSPLLAPKSERLPPSFAADASGSHSRRGDADSAVWSISELQH